MKGCQAHLNGLALEPIQTHDPIISVSKISTGL